MPENTQLTGTPRTRRIAMTKAALKAEVHKPIRLQDPRTVTMLARKLIKALEEA